MIITPPYSVRRWTIRTLNFAQVRPHDYQKPWEYGYHLLIRLPYMEHYFQLNFHYLINPSYTGNSKCEFFWNPQSLSKIKKKNKETNKKKKQVGHTNRYFFLSTNVKCSEQWSSDAELLNRKQLLKTYCSFVLIVQCATDENSEWSDFFSIFECEGHTDVYKVLCNVTYNSLVLNVYF